MPRALQFLVEIATKNRVLKTYEQNEILPRLARCH
jgi:hypothetical protein